MRVWLRARLTLTAGEVTKTATTTANLLCAHVRTVTVPLVTDSLLESKKQHVQLEIHCRASGKLPTTGEGAREAAPHGSRTQGQIRSEKKTGPALQSDTEMRATQGLAEDPAHAHSALSAPGISLQKRLL